MNKTYITAQKTTKTALLLLAGASLLATISPVTSVQAAQADVKSSFSEEQKAEMETMFRQFISNNPELIMESVRQFHEEQEKKAMQSVQESFKENLEKYQEVFAKKELPMVGNPDGDITVIEFFDYNCGYCKRAFNDIMSLVEKDKNIRIVFQDLPILSPTSQKMSELSLAAQKQGKYFEIHKALMEYRGSQNDEAFMKLAEEVGLDTKQLKKDAESEEIKKEVSDIKKMAQALGVRGTPGFIIGDVLYPGYISEEGLSDAINKAREKAKEK